MNPSDNKLSDNAAPEPTLAAETNRLRLTRRTLLLSSAACLLPAVAEARLPGGAAVAKVPPYLMAQLGHSRQVSSMAFSPDGKHVLIGDADRTALLWEIATGKEIRRFEGQLFVSSVVFSPDGRFILTGDADKTARLWDVTTGKEIRRFEGHSFGPDAVAFSLDGRYVLTGSWDETARLWETATGKEIRRFEVLSEEVSSVAFSPDVRFVLTGTRDGIVRLWGADAGQEVRRFQTHSSVESVTFSPDGKFVLTGSGDFMLAGGNDKTARLWETATGKEIRSFEGHFSWVQSVAFSSDGRYVLTGSDDGTTRLWETATGKALCSLLSFDDGTWAVTDNDGRYDASNGGDVQGLCWVVNNTSVELKQFKADYYEPGLLAKLLGFNKEPLRHVKPLAELEVNLPPVASVVQQNGQATITLADQGGGIGPTEVFVNDQRLYTEPTPRNPGKSFRFTLDLTRPEFRNKLLPAGENVLTVVGHTYDKAVRPDRPDYLAGRAVLASLPTPDAPVTPPRVFLLAVGASRYAGPRLTLRFAAKDAIDFHREVTAAAVGWLGKERVFSTLLASDAEHPECKPASRANILAALDAIARDARSTDILVLYLAGHGVAAGSGDRDYYYVTADADDATPGTALFPTVTLSGAQLGDRLTKINAARKAVVLDTCASGEFGRREVSGDIKRSWEDMKDHTGSYILAGCASDAVSYESSRYNQGLLTYCLLEAMKANDGVWVADPKAGGTFLDIQKWLRSAEAAVPRLVEEAQIVGVQSPEFKSASNARDFYVGRLSPDERKAIRLATPLPILLPPQNVRDEASPLEEDTLNLRARVDELLLAKSSRGRGQGYALWKTDAQPGAYRFNIHYRVGSEVAATVILLRFPKDARAKAEPVATFTLSSPPDKLPEALLNAVVQQIETAESKRRAE